MTTPSLIEMARNALARKREREARVRDSAERRIWDKRVIDESLRLKQQVDASFGPEWWRRGESVVSGKPPAYPFVTWRIEGMVFGVYANGLALDAFKGQPQSDSSPAVYITGLESLGEALEQFENANE